MNSLGKIGFAVAAALGATSAFALNPTDTIAAKPLYAAGGSAQTNSFVVAAFTLLNNVDIYTDDAGGAQNGSYRIVSGTTKAIWDFGGKNIPAGTNVVLFYKFNGGSFVNGINPFTGTGGTLPFPKLSNLTGATVISGATAGSPTYKTSTAGVFGVAGNQEAKTPAWGVADVEVALFRGFNNPTIDIPKGAGSTDQNTNGGAAPSVGASVGIYDNLFGVAVTSNLYSVKKNFTKAEVAGILSGIVQDWSQLNDDNGVALTAGPVILLDRGQGSGSKAAGNEYFLNYPSSGSSGLNPNSANNNYTQAYTGGTFTVTGLYQDVKVDSSGHIIDALGAAQGAGARAIAILGLETPPNLNKRSGNVVFQFTAINGVAVDKAETSGATPDNINGSDHTSYINVVKGNYDFYYQNSFNTLHDISSTVTGDADVFANKFKEAYSSVAFVGANAGLKYPQAVPGTLVDPITGASLDKGVLLNSRLGDSSAPAVPLLSGAIPASSDPLN